MDPANALFQGWDREPSAPSRARQWDAGIRTVGVGLVWLLTATCLRAAACEPSPAGVALPWTQRVVLAGQAGTADFSGVFAKLTLACEPEGQRLNLALEPEEMRDKGAVWWPASSLTELLSSEPPYLLRVDGDAVEIRIQPSRHRTLRPSWIWARSGERPNPIPVFAGRGILRASLDKPLAGSLELHGRTLAQRPVTYRASFAAATTRDGGTSAVPTPTPPPAFDPIEVSRARRLQDAGYDFLRQRDYHQAAEQLEEAGRLYRLQARLTRHLAPHHIWIAEKSILERLALCYFHLQDYDKLRKVLESWLALVCRLEEAGLQTPSPLGAPTHSDALPLLLENRLQRLPTNQKQLDSLAQSADYFEQLVFAYLTLGRSGPALEAAELGRGRAYAARLAERDGRPVALEPVSLRRIREIVAARASTTVAYLVTDELLVIWVIQPDGSLFSRTKAVSSQQLKAAIDELVQGLKSGSLAQEERIATLLIQLHGWLVAPIESLLPVSDEEVVTWIPHGELFRVPFAALRPARNPSTALLYHWPSAYGPSIAILGQLAERPTPAVPRGLLALVDPRPLPRQESPVPEPFRAAAMLSTLPGHGARVLLRDEASECALKELAEEHSLIFLGSHGFAEELGSPDTAILLGRCPGEDGFLTPGEIAGLDLDADLVVLASCESGRGQLHADGVQGLARAFFAAGARGQVLSLWQVPAEETFATSLMFLGHWLRDGMPKALALQRAQQHLATRYPRQPGMWSGLILVGGQ